MCILLINKQILYLLLDEHLVFLMLFSQIQKNKKNLLDAIDDTNKIISFNVR
jgi:hypothetical protein